MRSIKHLSDDVIRSFERASKLETELQDAHAAGDFERSMKASIELKRTIVLSKRHVAAFVKAVKS